jgi:hypothetical protein
MLLLLNEPVLLLTSFIYFRLELLGEIVRQFVEWRAHCVLNLLTVLLKLTPQVRQELLPELLNKLLLELAEVICEE